MHVQGVLPASCLHGHSSVRKVVFKQHDLCAHHVYQVHIEVIFEANVSPVVQSIEQILPVKLLMLMLSDKT